MFCSPLSLLTCFRRIALCVVIVLYAFLRRSYQHQNTQRRRNHAQRQSYQVPFPSNWLPSGLIPGGDRDLHLPIELTPLLATSSEAQVASEAPGQESEYL